jgi:hypothetical protein
MTEFEAIEAAYTDTLKSLYLVLYDALVVSSNTQEALDRFKTGLAHARDARQLALKHL